MTARRRIVIEIEAGEDYQDGVLRRLRDYGITQRELCDEIGVDESQFSRWVASPSKDTGKAMDMRLSNAVKIEAGIEAVLARRRKLQPASPYREDR